MIIMLPILLPIISYQIIFQRGLGISYHVIQNPDHLDMDQVSREVWIRGMVLYVYQNIFLPLHFFSQYACKIWSIKKDWMEQFFTICMNIRTHVNLSENHTMHSLIHSVHTYWNPVLSYTSSIELCAVHNVLSRLLT